MKMQKAHYDYMLSAIAPLKDRLVIWKDEVLTQDLRVQDLNKRLRWDALYAAKLMPWVCDVLYDYLNDDHIDTALKSIMKGMNLERTN